MVGAGCAADRHPALTGGAASRGPAWPRLQATSVLCGDLGAARAPHRAERRSGSRTGPRCHIAGTSRPRRYRCTPTGRSRRAHGFRLATVRSAKAEDDPNGTKNRCPARDLRGPTSHRYSCPRPDLGRCWRCTDDGAGVVAALEVSSVHLTLRLTVVPWRACGKPRVVGRTALNVIRAPLQDAATAGWTGANDLPCGARSKGSPSARVRKPRMLRSRSQPSSPQSAFVRPRQPHAAGAGGQETDQRRSFAGVPRRSGPWRHPHRWPEVCTGCGEQHHRDRRYPNRSGILAGR